MPTFCRHNRFIERCPICSATLPQALQGARRPPRAKSAGRAGRAGTDAAAGARAGGAGGAGEAARERRPRGAEHVRVRREERATQDGYSSPLLQGVRSSADALRLTEEIAFANGRLLALAADPPGLYGELRALAEHDLERATWGCFLTAYLSPLQYGDGEDPFAAIRVVFAAGAEHGGLPEAGELASLQELALGPRTSHERSRGQETLIAYLHWAERGGHAAAFRGDPAWTPERRFQRLFERLALPGLQRAARYELLLLLGRLALYELRADSLALASARANDSEDLTTQGAKRVFAIGDALLLERRAADLARAAQVPAEALELALANWAAGERATLGFPADALDEATFERVGAALGL